MRPPRIALALAACLGCSGCGGSHRTAPTLVAAAPAPARESTVLGGASDGLAAELLLAGSAGPLSSWHEQQVALADPDLAAALDGIGLDHLRSSALGFGTGPNLLGSATVRRLAVAPSAPRDENGDGSNLDETLRDESQRIVSFAGATLPPGLSLPVFPWRLRSAELAASLPAGQVPAPPWPTQDLGDRRLRMVDAARFLRLRAIASRRLLAQRHRGAFGADAQQGRLGLLAVQQLLAAEETLFDAMFTRQGPLGPLPDPAAYDPGTEPRWLPSELVVDLDPSLPGAPVAWRATDDASSLDALAVLMLASAELTSLTEGTGAAALPGLFRGRPFAPPPRAPIAPSTSWTRDIAPLLAFRCGQCHLAGTFGGFSIASYEQVVRGGNRTRAQQLTFLVPGNAQASILYRVLTDPPPSFVRMPLVGEVLPAELARIVAWIDGGALKDPPTPPAPPRPGDDLLQVSFRNLVALHLDPDTGLLHHRYEADGPSGVATAESTGLCLQALAELDRVAPALEFRGWTPRTLLLHVLEFAERRLVGDEGACAAWYEPLASGAAEAADVQAQAAMAAGLLAAAERLPARHPAAALARRATQHLLTGFVDAASGLFAAQAGGSPATYSAAMLASVLGALRRAEAAGIDGAAARRTHLLRWLRPALAFAEWDGRGEVLGDGIPDTDGNGVVEPAFAGGAHGALPLLADRFVVDARVPATDRPIGWSEHVRPLLVSKCGECHMHGNEEGGYRLDTRRSLATPGESAGALPMLVPGDPEASFLYRKVSSRQPGLGSQMPSQRPPLDAAGLAIVRRWILEGATIR